MRKDVSGRSETHASRLKPQTSPRHCITSTAGPQHSTTGNSCWKLLSLQLTSMKSTDVQLSRKLTPTFLPCEGVQATHDMMDVRVDHSIFELQHALIYESRMRPSYDSRNTDASSSLAQFMYYLSLVKVRSQRVLAFSSCEY